VHPSFSATLETISRNFFRPDTEKVHFRFFIRLGKVCQVRLILHTRSGNKMAAARRKPNISRRSGKKGKPDGQLGVGRERKAQDRATRQRKGRGKVAHGPKQ